MRVVVIGAYGLLGSYVTARLLADGARMVGVGRDVVAAKRRFPSVDWVRADLRSTSAARWLDIVQGADAVVNCAGALQDSLRDDLDAVHRLAVARLAEVCAAAGVRRLVHISAVGVESGEGRFSATKLAAEEALRATDLDWVILRPAVVLAPAAYGGSALLRGLAAFPGLIPAMRPDAVVQTVSVDDVAEAVARSVSPGAPSRFVCDLAAAEPTRVRDILIALRAWLGFREAPVVRVPDAAGQVAAAVADGLAWLGWRSPMRTASLRQLILGVEGRAGDARERLGLGVRSLAETLASTPAGVQERWFARLYFAKPLALATLVLFWAASGVIGLARHAEAARLLTEAGFELRLAQGFVTAGGLADLALAALVCFRRTAPLGLMLMAGLTAAYLVAASLVTPQLWADPLGPLVKSIPAAVLALVTLAMMEER